MSSELFSPSCRPLFTFWCTDNDSYVITAVSLTRIIWNIPSFEKLKYEKEMCSWSSEIWCNRPSLSMDSTSLDSTNLRSQIFRKKIPESSKKQRLNLLPTSSYLYIIYMIFICRLHELFVNHIRCYK